jgi:hypothetical protein
MGHNPKGHLQVAHEGKSVAYDRLPYPRVDKLGFEWLCIRILTWEDRLSELASYRKIHGTAMSLVATVETPAG